MSKSHISMECKLAATLLQMKRPDDSGVLQFIVPYEHAKQMTAKQIISLFQFDHWPVRDVDGGPSEPWNIEPRTILEHRRKTADFDQPEIAKQKRIRGETCNGPRRPIVARVNPWPPKGSRPFNRAAQS